ncbi:MAG: ADP-ribose pyrophosphatase [Chlamydiae bacterium]|nr:ADP-ribose pyrophosphatase [Chlamydiota bacterium]
MKWLIFLLSTFSLLCAEIDYHKLIAQFPEMLGRHGSWKQGEIEVATNPGEIKRIEKLSTQRFMRMGYSEEDAQKHSKCGVVADDHYWIWIRDAVTFPGGIPGTYDRMVWKSGLTGSPGACILPVLKNKKILVNINFRHATRCWEMELPGGARKEEETPEQSALRELKEETGCLGRNPIHLGDMTPDSGMICSILPVYYVEVYAQEARHQDESEAIALNIAMSEEEIQKAFLKGYIIIKIKGHETKVYCRNSFLSFALLQAKWRKLI